jgi:imidazoleglycerol-phosphate dehydratase/histidinol-phosphatase
LTLLPHALERFAVEAGMTLHVESAGADDHHVAEAAFKATGRALRAAVRREGATVPSTKGSL